MRFFLSFFKPAVAVSLLLVFNAGPIAAQQADLEALLEQLADPSVENWQQLERQIKKEWSRSGSASMDFLLQRGQAALDAEDFEAALEHFTALTDHAPDFAEGWNGRAKALFHQGLYGPAMEDLSKVLALNPQQFEAMIGVAAILQTVGQNEKALSAWRLVLKVHPKHPEAAKAVPVLEAMVAGVAL